MLERAKETTATNGGRQWNMPGSPMTWWPGGFPPPSCWIAAAEKKRLREELDKLRVEMNEEKSRKVELSKEGVWILGIDSDGSGVDGEDGDRCTRRSKKRTALQAQAHGDLPVTKLLRRVGDREDQFNSARMGGLGGGALSSVLLVHPRLGENKIRRHLM